MAALGAGTVDRERLSSGQGTPRSNPRLPPLIGGLNLVVPTADLLRVSQVGMAARAIGLPIMREGFVTGTGFLAAPSTDQTGRIG